MTIKYTNHLADLIYGQLYNHVRDRVAFLILFILVAFPIFSILNEPDTAELPVIVKVIVITVLMILIFGFVGVIEVIFLLIYSLQRKLQGLVGEHELEITEKGLVERTAFNESLHKWTRYQRVISTKKYLLIYVTNRSLHLVPKRFFSSEEEIRRFQTELCDRIRNATTSLSNQKSLLSPGQNLPPNT